MIKFKKIISIGTITLMFGMNNPVNMYALDDAFRVNNIIRDNNLTSSRVLLSDYNSSLEQDGQAKEEGTYKVVFGDTLGKIANKFGTTVDSLVEINNIANINDIKIGDILKLNKEAKILDVTSLEMINTVMEELVAEELPEELSKEEMEEAQEVQVATPDNDILPEVTAEELTDPALAGLTKHTAKMKVAIGKKFNVKNFSLFRAGDDDGTGHGHGTGMSVDYMVTGSEGDKIAEYLVKHMDELGIHYIIWKQRFYMSMNNIYGPANAWNLMPDRGGVTANHFDHVHVSFNK